MFDWKYSLWSPNFPKANINQKKVYIGITAGNWKQHFYNHRQYFKSESLKNQTELSKCYWDMKENGFSSQLKRKIISRARTPKIFREICDCCIKEIILIIKYNRPDELLNHYNEIIFKCRLKKTVRNNKLCIIFLEELPMETTGI